MGNFLDIFICKKITEEDIFSNPNSTLRPDDEWLINIELELKFLYKMEI